ncbi:MAG TPA: hypothetical protein VGK19_23215 [Capsulimonadaceae bacterium]|jgi:hypothetical protein
MENDLVPEQSPTVPPPHGNTVRRWLAFVVASALSGALVFIGVPYLSGWGIDVKGLIMVASVYIVTILPLLGFRHLLPSRDNTPWRRALGVAGVSLVCYLASILGAAVGFFSGGSPFSLPVAGMSDRIRYTNVGPVLVSWAKREMAAHPSPPSKSSKQMLYWQGDYPLLPSDLPPQATWIARKQASFFVIRDNHRDPAGVNIEVSYDTSIQVYPNPKLQPAEYDSDEQPDPLHPYPGITVRQYVR